MNEALIELFTQKGFSEIVWPPALNPLSAATFQMLSYLEQSQWFEPKKLEYLQAQQLLRLLRIAQENVPFYSDRLSRAARIKTPEKLIAHWHEIPILTRSELQLAGNTIFNPEPFEDHGEVVTMSTSGSTGKPVSIQTNFAAQFFSNVTMLRDHLWHKRDFSHTVAVIRDLTDPLAVPPLGRRADTWGIATQGIMTGPCFSLGLCEPKEQLEWLKKINPHYLFCYPTLLRSILDCVNPEDKTALTHLK